MDAACNSCVTFGKVMDCNFPVNEVMFMMLSLMIIPLFGLTDALGVYVMV